MKYLFLLLLILNACSKPSELTDLNQANECIELPSSTSTTHKAKLIFQHWSYAKTWENKQDVQLQLQLFDNGRIERHSECGWLIGSWNQESYQFWLSSLPKEDFKFFGDKKALFYPNQAFQGIVLHTPKWDLEYFLSDSIPTSTYTQRFQKMWDTTIDAFYLKPILWKYKQKAATPSNSSRPY